MNEHIEQQICIKFCGKLKHSPVETNCVRSQDTYFKGDSGVIVLCTIFLVIFFNKCL